MINRQSASWQIILADIALILFLTTLAAFVAQRSNRDVLLARPQAVQPQLASPQAIYRRSTDTSLGQWIRQQQPDDRLTLTIFARYSQGERQSVWQEVENLTRDAKRAGLEPRIIIEAGPKRDIFAALAYDEMPVRDPRTQ
ncbi:hypothetical protein [Qipengyuania sp. DGS5-3]|uniref:hypothetical protein n=1 Tax=Qipengyuania sp. DGS5-3 TaxID=3349632 RepID=UPI0036D3DBD5